MEFPFRLNAATMCPMKAKWQDPVKRPPLESTLQIEGDFGNFTELMKRVVRMKLTREEKQPTPASASPGPVAS